MNYEVIDLENFQRKEHFEHYLTEVPCTYSVTVTIDVTEMVAASKKAGHKFYPLMIFGLAQAVNKSKEFRMGIVANELVIWDQVHPSYTIFHQETETFSALWSENSVSIQTFLQNYQVDNELYGDNQKLFAKPHLPANHFNVSSFPWFDFTGFNLNLPQIGEYLAPSFTFGKYHESGQQLVMSLAIQVHHAVCDGYHVAQFIERLESSLAELARQL